MSEPDTFPRQSARTRRFTLGEPRSFTVCGDGNRVLFLRSLSGADPRTALWCLDLPDGSERMVVDPGLPGEEELGEAERARRERVRETAAGVVAYSADAAGRVAVFASGSALMAVEVDSGEVRTLVRDTEVFDPHVDPTGTHVAYADGRSLWAVPVAGGEAHALVRSDEDGVYWGRAEHAAAEEMNRFRGFWWAPDGSRLLVTRVDDRPVSTWWIADPAHPEQPARPVRYPAAGAANSDVTLHLVDLSGAVTSVEWDRPGLPYVARAHWSEGRPPLLQVQSRDQTRVQTLSVQLDTGWTDVLAEDHDPVWVELFDGVPAWCGEDLVRIRDDEGRRLVINHDAVTPSDVYVRRVVAADDEGVVFTASYGDPTQVHVARWTRSGGVEQLTEQAGVHSAVAARGVTVISSSAFSFDGSRHVVHAAERQVEIGSHAEAPVLTPVVRRLVVGERRVRAGVVLPRRHREGDRWPVLLAPYGGPHAQRVVASRAAWLEPQWFADQGFAVVVADGRGTPGRDPAWERAMHHDFTVALEDQIDALHEVAQREPALDLHRVGIRGWSFGGWLAALAVLRRPDVFHAAVAGAPVTDWRLYDTHYTERYLGHPGGHGDIYTRNSLLADAGNLQRPLLLIHGLADDNVVSAHTLQLSQRLTEHGRPHAVLPLTGVTHMTPQEAVAENLLLIQVEFLRAALAAQ